jgi:hypothetical protein
MTMISPIKRVRAALWWNKALDLAAHGAYERALGYVEAFENTYSGLPKGSKYGTYSKLLKGFILVNLSRFDQALCVLATAQKQMQSIPNPNPELEYLMCYAGGLGRSAMILSGKVADTPLFIEDFDRVDLDRVPAHIKRKFPLRTHPCWSN